MSTNTLDRPVDHAGGFDQWLTIADVMRITSMSRTKIYGLIQSGKLRSVAPGGNRRIVKSALVAYMAKCEAESTVTN